MTLLQLLLDWEKVLQEMGHVGPIDLRFGSSKALNRCLI